MQQQREIGAGLINLGNTCYISAVLQAFAHAPELYLAMDYENHGQTCPIRATSSMDRNVTGGESSPFCILCELEHHLFRVHSAVTTSSSSSNSNSPTNTNNNTVETATTPSSSEAISPLLFVKGFMTHVAPWFRIGLQEDSHEFLRLLIDAMQSSCIFSREAQQQEDEKEEKKDHDSIKRRKLELDTHSTTTDNNKEEENIEYPFRLFRGSIESTVTCSSCHAISRTLDPMEDLGLEVIFPTSTSSSSPMKKIPTSLKGKQSHHHHHHHHHHHRHLGDVTSSLQKFIDTERLDAAYTCEKCGISGQATKQSKLASIPPILTLHLKRFRYGTGKNGIHPISQGRNGTTTSTSTTNHISHAISSSNHSSYPSSVLATTSNGHSHPSKDTPSHNNQTVQHNNNNNTNPVGGGASGSGKIEGFIRFEQVLDLRPYLTQTNVQKQTFCRLFAIIVHIGKSSHSGHYIAYVRNMNKNEWYRMDDSKVMKVTKEEVDSAEAYMLFYRVVDHPLVNEWKRKSDEKRNQSLGTMETKKQEESHTKSTTVEDAVMTMSSLMEKDESVGIKHGEGNKVEIPFPLDSAGVGMTHCSLQSSSNETTYIENRERIQPKYRCIEDWEKHNSMGLEKFVNKLSEASSYIADQVLDGMIRPEYMDYLKAIVMENVNASSNAINISIYDIDDKLFWESARYALYDLFVEIKCLNEVEGVGNNSNKMTSRPLEVHTRICTAEPSALYHNSLEKSGHPQDMTEEEIRLDEEDEEYLQMSSCFNTNDMLL